MAANLATENTGRRSSSSSRREGYSHGRGGAGNIGPATDINPEDLETPTIKSSVYTTGRGGSGNMAKNTDPDAARKAQDVNGPVPRESVDGKAHVGRGGAANVFRASQDEGSERLVEGKQKTTSEKGLAEKGKEWLLAKAGKA